MDTERGHEGVARIKNAGLPVREWTPFGADRSRFNLDQTDARARSRLIDLPALRHLPFVGQQLPDNKVWRDECGSCHVAYHPTLLPARSWQALMDRQNDHFGEKLELDEATVAGILGFLKNYSAETGMTEPAYKINRSMGKSQR